MLTGDVDRDDDDGDVEQGLAGPLLHGSSQASPRSFLAHGWLLAERRSRR